MVPVKSSKMHEEIVASQYTGDLPEAELEQEIASHKLEYSYIGIVGRGIEPLVTPLGYDWKIGIAIVSSFAAREVFVGTLATIYSVGSDDEETIKNRMAGEVNPVLGGPLFTFASGISLLLFYAFAMQCMSTLAVVKKKQIPGDGRYCN
jgi:ferrous iron transport protein B